MPTPVSFGTLDLGDLNAGDTIYVAIGPQAYDYNDSTHIEFQVTQDPTTPANTPEPATIALLGLGAVGMLARRRWRRKA